MIKKYVFLIAFIIQHLNFVYAQNYKVGIWDGAREFRGAYNFTDTVDIIKIKALLSKIGDGNYVVYVGTSQVNLEEYKLPYIFANEEGIPMSFRPNYKDEKVEGGFYLQRDSLLDGAWLVFKVEKKNSTLYLKKSVKNFLLDGEMVMHGFNGKLHQILFFEKGLQMGVIGLNHNKAVSHLFFNDSKYLIYFDNGLINTIERILHDTSIVLYRFDKLGRIIYNPNKISIM